MSKHFLIIILLFTLPIYTSCESAKKAYLGIGKTEVTIRPTDEVLEYYAPLRKNDSIKTNIFVISNYDSADKALKEFGVPRIFLKNRKTGIVYELDCFEDVKASIDNLNNNIQNDDMKVKNPQEFISFTEFIITKNDSKLVASSGTGDITKKWDLYLSYATFLGKKLRRLTLPVTSLQSVNELNILDLSIDKSAVEIN